VPATTLQGATEKGSRNAHFTGLKIGSFGSRPYRQVAGPELSPTSLRLASLPLDPETAARIRRANERAFLDTAEIPTPSWPVVLVGGDDHEHELVHQARQRSEAAIRCKLSRE
jgi:hypothetical protein